MANPFRNQGKSTAKTKFASLGLSTANARHTDEGGAERILGRASGGRLEAFKRIEDVLR